jgi:hypothetical protein
MSHYFSDLGYDLVWITGDLTTTSMWHDTKSTEVVTPRLDDDIGTGGIFLELLHGEILVELRIVTDIFTRDEREYLGKKRDFLDTEYEVDRL